MLPGLRCLSWSSRDDHPMGLLAKDAQSSFKLRTSVRGEAISPQIFLKGEIIHDNTANLGL